MNVVIQLPDRLVALRRMTIQHHGRLLDVVSYAIQSVNESFIIDAFDSRIISSGSRRAALRFCELYQYRPFPLQHVDSCRYVTVHGVNLVLHDAKKL